eukprot:SAG31_NODE_2529_length_5556_cov_114.211472_8_plen_94_part_00
MVSIVFLQTIWQLLHGGNLAAGLASGLHVNLYICGLAMVLSNPYYSIKVRALDFLIPQRLLLQPSTETVHSCTAMLGARHAEHHHNSGILLIF